MADTEPASAEAEREPGSPWGGSRWRSVLQGRSAAPPLTVLTTFCPHSFRALISATLRDSFQASSANEPTKSRMPNRDPHTLFFARLSHEWCVTSEPPYSIAVPPAEGGPFSGRRCLSIMSPVPKQRASSSQGLRPQSLLPDLAKKRGPPPTCGWSDSDCSSAATADNNSIHQVPRRQHNGHGQQTTISSARSQARANDAVTSLRSDPLHHDGDLVVGQALEPGE